MVVVLGPGTLLPKAKVVAGDLALRGVVPVLKKNQSFKGFNTWDRDKRNTTRKDQTIVHFKLATIQGYIFWPARKISPPPL